MRARVPNNSRFDLQVRQWAERAEVSIAQFTKLVAFKVFTKTTMRTPVDTGRARASWNIVVGDSADTSVEPLAKWDGFNDEAEADSIASAKANRIRPALVYTISNNLPYIVALENGSSKQAPAGMLRLAIADVRLELAQQLGQA